MFFDSDKEQDVARLDKRIDKLVNRVTWLEEEISKLNKPFYSTFNTENIWDYWRNGVYRDEFTSQEVIEAILKHLNIVLKKEQIPESTNVVVKKVEKQRKQK